MIINRLSVWRKYYVKGFAQRSQRDDPSRGSAYSLAVCTYGLTWRALVVFNHKGLLIYGEGEEREGGEGVRAHPQRGMCWRWDPFTLTLAAEGTSFFRVAPPALPASSSSSGDRGATLAPLATRGLRLAPAGFLGPSRGLLGAFLGSSCLPCNRGPSSWRPEDFVLASCDSLLRHPRVLIIVIVRVVP